MSTIASWWFQYSSVMLWQSLVLMAVVLLLYTATRRLSPSFRYALLCLVLVKLLLPPSTSSFTGVVNLLPTAPLSWLWTGHATGASAVLSRGGSDELTAAVVMGSKAAGLLPAAQAARSNVSAESTDPWAPRALFGLWLAGACLLILALAWRAWRLRQALASATVIREGPIPSALADLVTRFGIRGRVEVVLADAEIIPFVAGWFRHRIVLPRSIEQTLSYDQVRAVLAHELTHVKRHDIFVNALQVALQVVFFYNPGLWIVNRLIRRERERACDDRVVRALGEHTAYAQGLLRLCSPSGPALAFGPGFLGVFESRPDIVTRLERIMAGRTFARPPLRAYQVAVLVALALAILPMGRTLARSWLADVDRDLRGATRSIQKASAPEEAEARFAQALRRVEQSGGPDKGESQAALQFALGAFYEQRAGEIALAGNSQEEEAANIVLLDSCASRARANYSQAAQGTAVPRRKLEALYRTGRVLTLHGDALDGKPVHAKGDAERLAQQIRLCSLREGPYRNAAQVFLDVIKTARDAGLAGALADSAREALPHVVLGKAVTLAQVASLFASAPAPAGLSQEERSAYVDLLCQKGAEGMTAADTAYARGLRLLDSLGLARTGATEAKRVAEKMASIRAELHACIDAPRVTFAGMRDTVHATDTSRSTKSTLTGGRSKANIMLTVMRNLGQLRHAYNHRLQEKPDIAGRLTIEFAVVASGEVVACKMIESTLKDAALEDTIPTIIRAWDFGDTTLPNDTTRVIYPFMFSR